MRRYKLERIRRVGLTAHYVLEQEALQVLKETALAYSKAVLSAHPSPNGKTYATWDMELFANEFDAHFALSSMRLLTSN